MESLQEPDSAATEESTQIGSNLCPLENFSEQTEMPAQLRAAMAANDGKETAEASAGNAPSAEMQEEASVIHPALKSAESTQSEDTAKESDIGKQKAATEQAEQAEDISGRSLSDMNGGPVAAAVENTAAETESGAVTNAVHVFQTLEELFTSYEGEGVRPFEIQLEPENLGKLSITLSMNEDGLGALIRTKDAQVQSLLKSELGALVDKLSESGVQIRSLDIVCSDMGNGQPESQGFGNADSGRGFHAYGKRNPEDMQTAYEDSDSTQIYAWTCEEMLGSTVSYRA